MRGRVFSIKNSRCREVGQDVVVAEAAAILGRLPLAPFTKDGLDAATWSLAIEYAEKGIRVNAVSPGVN